MAVIARLGKKGLCLGWGLIALLLAMAPASGLANDFVRRGNVGASPAFPLQAAEDSRGDASNSDSSGADMRDDGAPVVEPPADCPSGEAPRGPLGGDSVAGQECCPEARIRIDMPSLEIDGGSLDYSGPGLNLPDIPGLRSAKFGLWIGGRMYYNILPLSELLEPITEGRKVDDFDDYMLMVGPSLAMSIEDTLWVGLYFDMGFQNREEEVAGEERKADVNITRLGMSFKVLAPPMELFELEGLVPEREGGLLSPIAGRIRAGFGMDIGVGNLNASRNDDSLFKARSVNMPFFYLTPMAVGSLRINSYARVDFFVGYSFMATSNLSAEFSFDDKDMIDGRDLDGWVAGVEFKFGSESVGKLLPRLDRKSGDPEM